MACQIIGRMVHIKPTDLWIPCNFEERYPLLLDQFLYIPAHYKNHRAFNFPPFESPALFGRKAPLYAEFCSGNGEWITAKAQESPDLNWIAVEKNFDRVRRIWAKVKNLGLKNVLVVFGDARTFSEFYLQEGSLAKIFINFPDPWPKKRHAKHRLVQMDLALLLQRAIEPGGEAVLVTDDPDYSQQMIAVMLGSKGFRSFWDAPYYVHEWPHFGNSFFNSLWINKGRNIHFHRFIKI